MRKQGEGSYYRDGDYYCYVLRIGGKRYVRKARKQSALREKVYALHRELQATRALGRAPRLKDYLTNYLAQIEVAESTRRSYTRSAQLLSDELGRFPITKLTPSMIETALKVIARRGTRTATLARDFLRSALKAAERDGLLERNPAQLARAPRHTPRLPRVLAADEVHRLLQALSGRYAAVIKFLLFTGLRISEALALSPFDVTRDGVIVKRGKSDAARRVVPLGPSAREAVEEMMYLRRSDMATPPWEDSGRLFSTCTGAPMSARNVQRALSAALDRAGLPHYSLHDLRRTFGTHLAAAGVEEAALKALMGHTDIRLTHAHYLLALEHSKQAAILSLEDRLAVNTVTKSVTEDQEAERQG